MLDLIKKYKSFAPALLIAFAHVIYVVSLTVRTATFTRHFLLFFFLSVSLWFSPTLSCLSLSLFVFLGHSVSSFLLSEDFERCVQYDIFVYVRSKHIALCQFRRFCSHYKSPVTSIAAQSKPNVRTVFHFVLHATMFVSQKCVISFHIFSTIC